MFHLSRCFRVGLMLGVLAGVFSAGESRAEEIGYTENFALAKDRAEALKQLVPGTEDYYYYHCLYFQQTEQFAKVPEILKHWIARRGETSRVYEIQNRQALLTYQKNPQQSLAFLKQRLGLHFNHQRERLNQKPNLPLALDQGLISRQAMTQRAFHSGNNLSRFEDRALDWLIDTNLNPQRRRALLQRLQRPDHEDLPKHIVEDLNTAYSSGFGSMTIHRQLLLTQLDECLKLSPGLRNQTNFVNTYLTKLQPNPDVNWQQKPAERKAHLARLWSYVKTLAPAHNSLKAHVLYHQLALERSQGVYDKDRFMEFLKLPRQVHYMNQVYMNRVENRRYPVSLQANYQGVTLLPAISNDEPLVREFLAHFFKAETTWKAYETYINDIYLKRLFAETKIVNGLGDQEQWASLLPPQNFQELKERIDLDFPATNKPYFAPEDVISLDLDVKNVSTLIVKVFEINTKSYYRQNGKEVDTDINLDGLVPNFEQTLNYTEPPLLKVRRHFEFPKLTGRGIYVIDFIGNGKSSRMLVRKGRLHYLIRSGLGGQVFTVLDEQNRIVPGASIWISGHEYQSDKNAAIAVPFSNQPGRQPVVLCQGSFCSLDQFGHEAEQYELKAGFYVDREALLTRRMAKLLIRPQLLLNGNTVSLNVLEDVSLNLTSTDYNGVSTTKVFRGEALKLQHDKETAIEFRVPQRLVSMQYRLEARVKNLSQGKTLTLAAGDALKLNQIEPTDKTEQLLLARVNNEYYVSLLGKTGEPLAERAVAFSIKHKDFRESRTVSLQTNPQGLIRLGKLQDIKNVVATSPKQVQETWTLVADQHTQLQERTGKAGLPVVVALMTDQKKPVREEVSLLELRGGTFWADRFDALSLENGLLTASGLPRGDYNLLLKSSGEQIKLCVTEGDVARNYVLGEHRHLEIKDPAPLQISDVSMGEKTLNIQLENAGKSTRVHVFATRYQPAFSAYGELAAVRPSEPARMTVPLAKTHYKSGRNIGDEYRYIIERKYAKKYPGNMLTRPSLLLNPWAVRQTSTMKKDAEEGDYFGGEGQGGGTGGIRRPMAPPPITQNQDFNNLDFLMDTSAVLVNLTPDKNGRIAIPREELGPHQEVHVVAVDVDCTVSKQISLPAANRRFQDLRLVNGFAPDKHFTQQKHISILKNDSEFTLSDISTAKFENYDSLAKVYSFYATLSGDAKLAEFQFILDWPTLKEAEKREKYSKFACHELSYFLFKKDPKFFTQVVRPYLQNKKNKTFLDEWLIGANLSAHRQSWEYQQLNVVERILLSQQIQGEQVYTARHVSDVDALTPPNQTHLNQLFAVALSTSALNDKDGLGLENAKDNFTRNQRGRGENRPEGTPAPVMPGFDAPSKYSFENKGKSDASERPSGESKPGERRPGDDAKKPAPKPAEPGRQNSNRDREAGKKRESEKLKELSDEIMESAERDLWEDLTHRKQSRQYYRVLEKTQEWVENNYYHVRMHDRNANLITANPFWTDYAVHDGKVPFYSVHFAEAGRNFPEMMFALSVLDLPFQSPEHKTEFAEASMKLTTGGPMIVLHEEIEPAKAIAKNSAILVNENFFRYDDRYRYENGERFDKFITDEFVVHTVYGCQIVVTNPTSSKQKLDLLLQIPVGAIPVLSGRVTNSIHMELAAFHTSTLEYSFYFPAAGACSHYPVQVARNEEIVAHGKPLMMNVVNEASQIDRDSWPYVSQYGSNAEVIEFLQNHNLERIDLNKIAFRMQDKAFFNRVMDLLAQRHVYNNTLWSYGIHHDNVPVINQYLKHADNFVNQTGNSIASRLLTIDPVARRTYEHRDYRPLVNARRHPLGRRREILNTTFHEHYHHLLKVLCYHRSLNDDQRMAVVYYLLLQDRVEQAVEFFDQVNPENLATRLQYDYFAAYLAMYRENLKLASEIAARHENHPVDRWRNTFASVSNQLGEIAGGKTKVADEENQQQQQTKLAATESTFNYTLEGANIKLHAQNLTEVRVNYYLMDIELLFSRNPFVQKFSGEFSAIKPNQTQLVKLPKNKTQHMLEIPDALLSQNVLVEIQSGGHTQTATYYANSLAVQIVENYGHLKVRQAKTGELQSKVYVKVYARMKDGRQKFYKDGYTDLRGMFDYVSLSTDELAGVDRFAILVLSEDHGAIVRETAPPKR